MTENPRSLPEIPERRYTAPPVVEALCEIYFNGSRWDPTVLGLFYERVREEYPQKSQLDQVSIEVRMAQGLAATRSFSGELRMCFAKADNSRLLQLGRDLLVVNQLLPYSHYEEWREAVGASLNVYRELATPVGISNLGMRYINRITIPGESIRMENFFRIYPEIPQELGDRHGTFQLQLSMIPLCTGHQLMLTLGSLPPERSGTMSMLLDLYDMIPLQGRDAFGEVEHILDESHANIIHTFENTITDTSRKLFGEIAHV